MRRQLRTIGLTISYLIIRENCYKLFLRLFIYYQLTTPCKRAPLRITRITQISEGSEQPKAAIRQIESFELFAGGKGCGPV